MQKYSFFNSVNGDRKYKAEDLADYYSAFISNGVFPLPEDGLKVKINEQMSVKVSSGKAWINGYYFHNTTDEILSIDMADGVLKRIDRIVVRLDLLNRCITLNVKKGSFASIPKAPELQRDADMYELALADILINNGITAITTELITDQRKNADLCGIVTQTVETIDAYNLISHLSNAANPHNVSLKQVGGSNQNLLDNWDFTNPINQRGQTSYTSGYTIDRWKMTGTGTVAVNSGSLSLQRTGSWFNFFQIIDNPQRLAGKTVTFSVKGSRNYNILFLINSAYSAIGYNNTAVGIASITKTLPAELTNLAVYIQPQSNSTNTIYAAKLELGSVSTLENNPPMDYQTEYVKCLMYYFQGSLYTPSITVLTYNDAKYDVKNLQFPIKMRITPTITLPNGQFATRDGYTDVFSNPYGIKRFCAITLDGISGGISGTTEPGCVTIAASADL